MSLDGDAHTSALPSASSRERAWVSWACRLSRLVGFGPSAVRGVSLDERRVDDLAEDLLAVCVGQARELVNLFDGRERQSDPDSLPWDLRVLADGC